MDCSTPEKGSPPVATLELHIDADLLAGNGLDSLAIKRFGRVLIHVKMATITGADHRQAGLNSRAIIGQTQPKTTWL